MELTYTTISRVLEHYSNDGEHYMEWCSEYGEPGYGDSRTSLVVLGDYWCRCGATTREDGSNSLHGLAYHHPRLWAAMESAGVKFEWSDEWWIDSETNKAWRTQADSYSWQSSIQWDEDACDYLTPDHDIAEWIDWAAREPAARCIPSRVWSSGDLMLAGFTEYGSRYENGWHPDQTDDPATIIADIHRWHGEDVEIVFLLDAAGQFDIRFSAWIREPERDEDGAGRDDAEVTA